MTAASPNRLPQKRTLETHARLLEASRQIVDRKGFAALRIEDVVADAGVAKGTFFTHFRDRDALLEQLIADDINRYLDEIESLSPPRGIDDLVDALMPMLSYMSAAREVFDIILRYSGAAASEEIGPIAKTFWRRSHVIHTWLAQAPFRDDVPDSLLAEGIDAFAIQAVALNYCAINQAIPLRKRLTTYLSAWLKPGNAATS